MRVLVVNAGSRSVKLRMLGADDTVLAATDVEQPGDNVDTATERRRVNLAPLAPLHQVAAAEGMRPALPDVAQVACFDTAAFHATPARAQTSALRQQWRDQWPIRRFGFHGLSHNCAVRAAAVLTRLPSDGTTRRELSSRCGGILYTAVDGQSVDMTGGSTPLTASS